MKAAEFLCRYYIDQLTPYVERVDIRNSKQRQAFVRLFNQVEKSDGIARKMGADAASDILRHLRGIDKMQASAMVQMFNGLTAACRRAVEKIPPTHNASIAYGCRTAEVQGTFAELREIEDLLRQDTPECDRFYCDIDPV